MHLVIYGIFAFLFVFVVELALTSVGEVDPDAEQLHYTMFAPFIPTNVTDEAKVVAESVAAIKVELADNVGYGSGFIVEDGVVATAAHVIDHENIIGITVFCNEREVEGTVIVSMPERDVALLAADCTGAPATYDLAAPDVDMRLLISGYDFERDQSRGGSITAAVQFTSQTSPIPTAMLTSAKISDEQDGGARELVEKMEAADSPPLIAIAGAIDPGNSGSPVFSFTGEIVGMVVISDMGRNRSFFVPAESILIAMIAAATP